MFQTVERRIAKLVEKKWIKDLTPKLSHRPHEYVTLKTINIVSTASKAKMKASKTESLTSTTESPTQLDRESVKDTKDTLKDTKPAKAGKKRDPLLDHPAIIDYKETAHLHVPIPWRKKVSESVGDNPHNVEKWKQLIFEWIGYGWNKQNVKGMLEAFQNGGIKRKGKRDDPLTRYKKRLERMNGE